MQKLANFTLHNQADFVDTWREFGFEMDPKPRAPLIAFERGEWTESAILEAVYRALRDIEEEGFDAILIGGLSNAMAYAWILADRLGLEVVMARTPRERNPDGSFVFRLAGYSKLLTPVFVENYPATGIIGKAMQEARKAIFVDDAIGAVEALVVAVETLEELLLPGPEEQERARGDEKAHIKAER